MENLHRPQKKKKFHFDLETEKKTRKKKNTKNTWTGLKEENVSRNEKMREEKISIR